MRRIGNYLRHHVDRPMVRPFALAGPILILCITLPLLRPLRHPDPGEVSNDETLRLATVRALVEHGSLALDRGYAAVPGAVTTTVEVSRGSGLPRVRRTADAAPGDSSDPAATNPAPAIQIVYSSQPPMMSVLLAAPAWVMTRLGYSFEDNHLLIAYVLTLLGVTLPVAGAAGLFYRMARLFELRRYWRAALGFAVVAASGLLSYAVVLNPYAPAAALVIASAACLIHVASMNRADRRAGWFALAGACAALAATLDPAAAIILVLFICVIPAMRFSRGRRLAGVLLYIIGATPVVALHAAWNFPITGDMIPGTVHTIIENRKLPPPAAIVVDVLDEDELAPRPFWSRLNSHIGWFFSAALREHGLLSHFPVMLFGILGISAVMHRHWPGSTKTLAAASGTAALIILLWYRMARLEWSSAMFASQWFVVFAPILLFWSGAWVRRDHRPLTWGLAGAALAFSIAVGILGALDPMPRHGFDGYTAATALSRLTHPENAVDSSVIAGRNP